MIIYFFLPFQPSYVGLLLDMPRNAWHTVINCSRWHCHTTTCHIPGHSTWLCLLSFSVFPNPLLLRIAQSSFLTHLATYCRRFFFSNSPKHLYSVFNILKKTSKPTPSWNSQAWQMEKGRESPVIWVAHAKNTKKLTEQVLYSLRPPCLHSSLCPAIVQDTNSIHLNYGLTAKDVCLLFISVISWIFLIFSWIQSKTSWSIIQVNSL